MLIDSSGVKEAQVAVALVDTAESKTQRIDHHRWTFIPPTQQRSHYPPVTSYCAIDLVVGDDGDGAQGRVLQYLFENTYSHVVSIIPIFRGGIRRLGVKKRTHDRGAIGHVETLRGNRTKKLARLADRVAGQEKSIVDTVKNLNRLLSRISSSDFWCCRVLKETDGRCIDRCAYGTEGEHRYRYDDRLEEEHLVGLQVKC